MELKIQFRNSAQQDFFWSQSRNSCFSGGFGNGKTYIACLKAIIMLLTFPKYRMVIARQVYKDLKATTMTTFFKIMPREFVERHSEQEGYTKLKNGSEILWMHLDSFDEQSLRGLEINSALIDQGEEVSEGVFLILDARIGRWDQAIVPSHVLSEYIQKTGQSWPLTPLGNHRVHNYIDVLCNPDTKFHWIYRKYHPESSERRANHFYVEYATDENLNDPASIAEVKTRDKEFVDKYYKGIWGTSDAQIHHLSKQSILEYTPELLKEIQDRGALFRSLDHGDAAPTCCLWVAAFRGVYIFYREYYLANSLISRHRENIHLHSGDETYFNNYADPAIFKKMSQKDGGFWSISDEYITNDIPSPPLIWQAADNNEFATRNRINELLRISERYTHPLNKTSPAPGVYFIRKSDEYQSGCFHSIKQVESQRRIYLGSDNGKSIFSEERDDSVEDHAYDTIRYFVAMHGVSPKDIKRSPTKNTFAYFNEIMKSRRANLHSLSAASVGN